MKPLGKRGVLDQLGGLVQALGFIAILLAVVFLVVAAVKTQVEAQSSSHSTAYNATSEVQTAMSDIPGWLPIIVIAVIGGILLTLIQFFRGRR